MKVTVSVAPGDVTIVGPGTVHELPRPFQVFATQNPIEQEGTYSLPEAQLDRFMFSIEVGYPSEDEEVEIRGGYPARGGCACHPT